MRAKLVAMLVVVAAIATTSCGEPPAEPDNLLKPAFDAGGAAACPTPADYVADDEASLQAALAAAGPGEVIGVDGYFGVTMDVAVYTEDLTLTCVTPGSGFYAEAGAGVIDLIAVYADDVTVEHLVLDAIAVRDGALWGNGYGGTTLANSQVTCGPVYCLLLNAAPTTVVRDNHFVSYGSITGVHLQNDIDGSRVEGNTVVAEAPSTLPGWFGGIRALGGSGVSIHQNIVLGPWQNSIHISVLSDSYLKGNVLEGAVWDGILLWPDNFHNVIRNNKATRAGEAGTFVAVNACSNTFIGNNLNGNTVAGAWFWFESGANMLVGNQNVVIDDGDWDCDGDGNSDANMITGAEAILHGVQPGKEISEAAKGWNDIK